MHFMANAVTLCAAFAVLGLIYDFCDLFTGGPRDERDPE